jgi:hypothetical protein
LKIGDSGVYLDMNANTTLQKVRDLARSKAMELQPMAGEEMNLAQPDEHRDGFIAGERALAGQILELLGDEEMTTREELDPVEEEMVLALGQT